MVLTVPRPGLGCISSIWLQILHHRLKSTHSLVDPCHFGFEASSLSKFVLDNWPSSNEVLTHLCRVVIGHRQFYQHSCNTTCSATRQPKHLCSHTCGIRMTWFSADQQLLFGFRVEKKHACMMHSLASALKVSPSSESADRITSSEAMKSNKWFH